MTYKKQRKQWQKQEKFLGKSLSKSSNSKDCEYNILFKPVAERGLLSLTKKDQKLISHKIDKLINDPYPNGVKKLRGSENIFRLRVRHFRIIYTIKKRELCILVLIVGDRKDVYKNKS